MIKIKNTLKLKNEVNIVYETVEQIYLNRTDEETIKNYPIYVNESQFKDLLDYLNVYDEIFGRKNGFVYLPGTNTKIIINR